MTEQPKPNWKEMSPAQRGSIATLFAKIDGLKALLMAVVGAALLAQPIWQTYYKNQSEARSAENLRTEKQAEAAIALSKAAISEVTALSAQQGELKAENQNLRRELASLTEKYKQLEHDYVETLEQKRQLEARIDELFKKHIEKSTTPR